MFRRLLSGAGLALGGFHVWIFARQAASGSLASPETLLKWVAAAGLVAALVALRRQGVPLLRGRTAVAIWVLAALLHAPAVGQRLEALETPAIPQAIVTLSEVAASMAPLAGILLLLWIARRHVAVPHCWCRAAVAIVPSAFLAGPSTLAFSPRPPPLA